ncbi:HAMP domain-containing histidine kinase, partial [Candidatus Poribacteria bacterium]|nr:HAMP domain-containing histidine kinase [Candidatus Poribacteria bacterium]
TMVYFCQAGMIGLVAPVYVSGEVVAILTSGCKKPKEGSIWPKEILGNNGYQKQSGKIDLWKESKNRIEEMEKSLGIESGKLLREIVENSESDSRLELSPDELDNIVKVMEFASNELSELADRYYRLEKESIIGWIRAEVASALSSTDTFWDKIQWCFSKLAQLLDFDYILFISQNKIQGSPFYLHCQHGLSQDVVPDIKYDLPGSLSQVDNLFEILYNTQTIQELDLRKYRDLPIFGSIYGLYGKGVNYPVIVAPSIIHDEFSCLLLGKKEPILNSGDGSINNWLREDDIQFLTIISRELAIIKNVFFSMKKLQETVEEQTNFMESLSHDLRTPIQNIIMAAENLREGRIPAKRASRTIAGLITQLNRLDLLAQKAWMLEQIRLDKLIYNDSQPVNYYKILEECRELMTDMAEREAIEIQIEPDIKTWKPIYMDEKMLRQLVLNLVHNGIKYSFPNTHIRLGGWQDRSGIGVSLTFSNEGILIRDEEKDLIFQRYFRANNAVKMNPSGSGIGLALVKEFVDHYNGKIDVISTEIEFGRYLNVFSIFLPGR